MDVDTHESALNLSGKIPMMVVRMRCPACRYDYRFAVQDNTPAGALPEITKEIMRCKCKNHIPKIDKNTPLEKTLMSINGIPLRFIGMMRPDCQ